LRFRRLGLASTPLELAWIHHEFSMYLLSIQRFHIAKFYMKKGLEYAEEAKSDPWILNIYHLILRMEICQNHRNEAKDAAVLASECAKKLNIKCLVKINPTTLRTRFLIAPVTRGRIYSTIDSRSDVLFKINSQHSASRERSR